MVRVAAAGDIHASQAARERVRRAFSEVEPRADLVLLAGDLTTTGLPDEAQVLADACAGLSIPVFAVVGNHDCHAGRHEELVATLEAGGIQVLDGAAKTCTAGGIEVGIVGTKGFVGGFAGAMLPDFGEPILREVYAETTRDAEAIADGLIHIVHCDVKIVLLHYAPVAATLEGEPEGIHVLLGSERLALPIAEHGADLVLHGHAHAGTFEGRIGSIPVYNVAMHVMGRDFWIFDLEPSRPRTEVAVE
jgi:Icc-related predicted phosphoesterase